MNSRYLNELNAINSSIAMFNQFLNPNFQVPTFDFETMINDQKCVKIMHGDWNAFGFPNSARRGVYFVFGHEKNMSDKNGIYIGKASFSSSIGARLYPKLHPYRSNSHFEMKGYFEETYILDYIASIDLDSIGIPFMAPALEEHLITVLQNELNLLNGTGNKRSVDQIDSQNEEQSAI